MVRTRSGAAKCRHHDEPAVRELVVTHDGVAVVPLLARSGEAGKDRIGWDAAVQHAAGRIELLTLLGEDREPRIDGLDDVVRSDCQAVVGRISYERWTLRSVESKAKSVEAGDQLEGRAFAMLRLFDCSSSGVARCDSRRPAALLLFLGRRERVRRAFSARAPGRTGFEYGKRTRHVIGHRVTDGHHI